MFGKFRLIDLSVPLESDAVSEPMPAQVRYITHDGEGLEQMRQFFALSESYPDLKANQNMLKLQEELTSTENRIAFSRQHYNDSVRRYNTKLEQVPTNIVKSFGDFPPMEFFEIEDSTQREAPQVSFG